MQGRFVLPIWKEVPFLRIIIPLIAGILIQDSSSLSITTCSNLFILSLLLILLLAILPITKRFYFRHWKGICLFTSLLCTGILITSLQQAPLQKNWAGHFNSIGAVICAEVSSAPVEKDKSYKINAVVQKILTDSYAIKTSDKVILYIEKDSIAAKINIGDHLYFEKTLQEIKSAGNPGSFDYRRYSILQQCYFQVYLPQNSYSIHEGVQQKWKQFLQESRNWLVRIIKKYIPSKREAGLAEALLIAYKDDLDKTLVQSYANTGVVHIIAISGLHLGLVYWLLATLLNPIGRYTKMKWIKPLGVIAGLWLFSLLAGASPSVLRSAVMFSFLVAGELFGKRTNAINNLAASAFLLLCFNPFWLWDAGFQLSYAAVLSLLVFMKPVYQLFTIKNKWLDLLWKMNAVTLSAQILTIPICIFYFHQFPNAFLLTNLIAVPLSSLILFLELALCAVASLDKIASLLGQVLEWLLYSMNYFIEYVSHLPFAVWEHLYLSLSQTILLYILVSSVSAWLFTKSKTYFIASIVMLSAFFSSRMIHITETSRQKKLVVYNIAKKQAADIFIGNKHIFIGDSLVDNNSSSALSPLYINRLQLNAIKDDTLVMKFGFVYKIRTTTLLFFSAGYKINPGADKIKVGILCISNNPITNPKEVLSSIETGQIVLDASNNYKTVLNWRKEAAILGIPCHSVVDNGAFVINLP